jgi:hypothetical protein
MTVSKPRVKKTPAEREVSEIKNFKWLYCYKDGVAKRMARRMLVNKYGYDDDYMPGYDDGETPKKHN